jgi:hypothetical protein
MTGRGLPVDELWNHFPLQIFLNTIWRCPFPWPHRRHHESTVSKHSLLSRWSIAARVLAALVGGYALAYGCTAFLSVYLPLARPDRVTFASLLSFAIWTAAVIYVFAARRARHAWLWLVGLTLLLCLAAFLPTQFGVRP